MDYDAIVVGAGPHHAPYPYTLALQHSDRLWRLACHIIRGEATYTGLLHAMGPLAWLVDAWGIVARRSRYSLARKISAMKETGKETEQCCLTL